MGVNNNIDSVAGISSSSIRSFSSSNNVKAFCLLIFCLIIVATVSADSGSESAEIDITISDECEAGILEFEPPGEGVEGYSAIGLNDTGYFEGIVSNTGNQNVSVEHELRVEANYTETENDTQGNLTSNRVDYIYDDEINTSEWQQVNISGDQTPSDEDVDWSMVSEEDDSYYNWNRTLATITRWDEEGNETIMTSVEEFRREFIALLPPGDYRGVLDIDYACEGENNGEGTDNETAEFEVLELDGEGVVPDDLGEDDEAVDTVFQDVEEPEDPADPQEGDLEQFPGVTEVPEPDPDPLPWLGLEMHPHNTTYTTRREGFTELGIEVENTGDANLQDIEIEPRIEDDAWNTQSGEIDELDVDERENSSVFLEPTDEVEPGFYQVPVYATLPERDVDLEYLSVEVLPDLEAGQLDVLEVPTSLQFVMGTENDIPLVVENPGDENLTEVTAVLRDHDACGESTVAEIGDLNSGEQASGVIEFEAADSLEECDARLVVSSQEGNYAFAEVEIDIVEEEVIVPEEFRVPLVASLWTLLLVAYSVSFRKFNLFESPALKMPLILLIVGEVFLIVYLSSAYYGFLPEELIPF